MTIEERAKQLVKRIRSGDGSYFADEVELIAQAIRDAVAEVRPGRGGQMTLIRPKEITIQLSAQDRLHEIQLTTLADLADDVHKAAKLIESYPLHRALMNAYIVGFHAGYEKRQEDEQARKPDAEGSR